MKAGGDPQTTSTQVGVDETQTVCCTQLYAGGGEVGDRSARTSEAAACD